MIKKKSLSYKAFSKSPFRSVKLTTYFEVYDELFTKYRNKKIIFVEIGILSGGSLFMWRKFFGPKARIIGIDLNPNAKKWEKYGFEIHIGDQSDVNFWKKFKKKVGSIDILLDDGGHKYEDQITSTECMLNNIKDNGMIVVEDTHTSYMGGFGNKKYSFINYIKNKIDKINYKFQKLNKKNYEINVWSIKIYESIVALCINNKSKFTKSLIIKNNGRDDKAEDYRNKKIKIHTDNFIYKFFKFFKLHLILNRVLNKLESANKIKKYFR
ncbi:class I SAM-dependent methyltransferase [Candidatus Pelagibacter sp.]|nr:class I SAM-dependent methyltransferase [Candidatus Pelagibacter sp.]